MKRLALALATSLVTLALTAGQVSATAPTPADGIVWSQNQRVSFRWHEGDVPPAWMRSAINAAANDSNDSRDAKAAVVAQSDSGASWIGYTGDIPTTWAIGYTTKDIPSSFTMRLRPQGYPLDWGSLRWCQFYDSPPTGCYDAEMIALHEFGHVQTLDHPDDAAVTDWTDTIMHWAPMTKAKAGGNQHTFGRCDVARLQIRYQPLTTSTPISTCLDLNSDVTLSSNVSSVASGSTVVLTARLKTVDTVVWPLLASQPLSSRTINVQRRAIGSTTWSSFGQMTPSDDNGHYTKSFSASDSYDYRVIFNSPANEGLEGDTSLVVRVTVSSGGGCGYGSGTVIGEIYIC